MRANQFFSRESHGTQQHGQTNAQPRGEHLHRHSFVDPSGGSSRRTLAAEIHSLIVPTETHASRFAVHFPPRARSRSMRHVRSKGDLFTLFAPILEASSEGPPPLQSQPQRQPSRQLPRAGLMENNERLHLSHCVYLLGIGVRPSLPLQDEAGRSLPVMLPTAVPLDLSPCARASAPASAARPQRPKPWSCPRGTSCRDSGFYICRSSRAL